MKEILNIKLEEIRNQKEQAMANLHALSGAEQVLVQLINELQTESKEANNVADNK